MIKVSSQQIQHFEINHLDKLRTLAPECMVLLRKNSDFPLHNPCEIALYGSGARETIKGGTGSGDVNVRHFVTVEEGLENAGFTVTTKAWMDAYKKAKEQQTKDFYKNIAAEARAKNKSVFVVGMGRTPSEPHYEFPIDGSGRCCVYVLARNSGEGADRTFSAGDFSLTTDEKRDILQCVAQYEKFILVLNVGGPVDLSPILDKVQNILLLSQLGSVTGTALADVLLGKSYPSGKLTTTWARAEDYPSIGDFAQINETRYLEGVFIGYRYFEGAKLKPIFPFGFGLGYADFNIKSDNFTVVDNKILVQATVTNIGNFKGKEVVQLYYSAPQGKLAKPVRELGTYVKTDELLPKQSQSLSLSLPIEDMASWDTEYSAWLLESGQYVISINNTPVGIVSLDFDVYTEQLGYYGGNSDIPDWQPQLEETEARNLPVIKVRAESLRGIGHYERNRVHTKTLKNPCLDNLLNNLSNKELATICVGRHNESQDMAIIIGNSASSLAGAAGESAKIISECGFGSIVMADGPAGLRISTKYIETDAGQEGIDFEAFSSIMNILPSELQKLILLKLAQNKERAKSSTVFYHYASAIPIGTALAQSWNPSVQEMCGDIVGKEMELFGINVWLAPALNIHRNVLCGRNFEYYSEDPVLSGRTATAVTQGVQNHEKCAVAIKHFACNNQETNRYGSNSVVSQRALREIYLKGFEICVKEAAPKFLMTSYNLLNGIHTANREDLLDNILRKEWGFEGAVMTDWGTTNGKFNAGVYGASSPALCIKAGNDLIMAGTKEDVDGILDSLNKGQISRSDLEKSAARILAISKELS